MSKQKDDLTWSSGPPPSLGWWPASAARDPDATRFYNGVTWSRAAYSDDSEKIVARIAASPSSRNEVIEWQHRPASWPARSRT